MPRGIKKKVEEPVVEEVLEETTEGEFTPGLEEPESAEFVAPETTDAVVDVAPEPTEAEVLAAEELATAEAVKESTEAIDPVIEPEPAPEPTPEPIEKVELPELEVVERALPFGGVTYEVCVCGCTYELDNLPKEHFDRLPEKYK